MAPEREIMAFSTTPLSEGWTFKQGDVASNNEYLEANSLPSEIHRDLLKHGKISDPFLDLNELSVQWVGNESWTYRKTFDAPNNHGQPDVKTVLKFEGLDTFAAVYINSELLFTSDNMFIRNRVDVTNKLKEQNNVLEIVFESARKRGLALVEEHKEHRFIVHQTEISRGPVRKAQHSFGWDWGPILLACGPWKPISIETYASRLFDMHVSYELASDLRSVLLRISVKREGDLTGVTFHVSQNDSKKILGSHYVSLEESQTSLTVEAEFSLENVELWWPRGNGPQYLYDIEALAHYSAKGLSTAPSIHKISRRIGFRKIELVQAPDSYGTSFYFRINHVDIFCGGSCWIPADSFLTRLASSDYRELVRLAAEGNQTMLRVWGGGIYEADAFYDAADEFGILVWQDFMFACANYPTYPHYMASIEKEARQNVRRIRHHPSVVIWAGNNEDYQIVERYGLDYNVDDRHPQSWLKTNFPARYIYEFLLPKIVEEESTGVPYHPSSPFGNGKSTVLKVDATIGDVHQWNVWHGTMEPYQRLPDMGGRFISEFGMEAYPHVSTLYGAVTQKDERYPGSMAMDFRNKAIGHERRLLSYVAENFKPLYDLENYTHLTQIMQADAMCWAYKSWRRQWGSSGDRKCGGVLVWQLNDCWPTISWAVIDYHKIPKPAYYAIKRAMAPIVVGVGRKFESWTKRPADALWQRDTGHINMLERLQHVEYEVWVGNNTMQRMQAEVIVSCISIATGQNISEPEKHSLVVEANSTTEVVQKTVSSVGRVHPCVIHATLLMNGAIVASDLSWPDPIKYLSFPDRDVKVWYSEDKSRAYVSAGKPVKGFVFSETKGMNLSDNGFDIVPGEAKEVVIKGCVAADQLQWKFVDM